MSAENVWDLGENFAFTVNTGTHVFPFSLDQYELNRFSYTY